MFMNQHSENKTKKVLSKWPLWPNPCRAPAVFELFAWPRYERGLCWTVEPRDTGACVCTCWCVCALDVFMETGWKMRGRGWLWKGARESFTLWGVVTTLGCIINTYFIFDRSVLFMCLFTVKLISVCVWVGGWLHVCLWEPQEISVQFMCI